MRILRGISNKIGKTELEEFDKAISVFKLQEGNIEAPAANKKIEKFKNFYKEYQAQLQAANMIDYDDILLSAVKLLEEIDRINTEKAEKLNKDQKGREINEDKVN